jgi:hypothetical protein
VQTKQIEISENEVGGGQMNRAIKGIAFLAVLVSSTVAAKAEQTAPVILLEEAVSIDRNSAPTLPIVGFRSASSSFITRKFIEKPGNPLEEEFFVPESVLVKAWMQDSKFAEVVKATGSSPNSIEQIRANGIDVEKFDWAPIENNSASVKAIVIDGKSEFSDVNKVDSAAIIAMTSAGLLDLSHKYNTVYDSKDQFALGFSPKYSKEIFNTYTAAAKYQGYPLSNTTAEWVTPNEVFKSAGAQYPFDLKKALTVDLGNATFGKSRIQSAKEAGFKVDERIAKSNDIYLFKFAVTLHDLPSGSVDEISFRVDCSDVCTAWELAPMRVTVVDEKTKSLNTPTVKIEGVEIGEFFRVSIVSKNLRPQIIAYGLQEDRFSWSLRDEAIGSGSFIFAAALGVPKGTKNFTLQRSVAVKTVGAWVTEGNWASTENMSETLQLRQ